MVAEQVGEFARAVSVDGGMLAVARRFAQCQPGLAAVAFVARANDDPKGFSLLAMVVSMFETRYLATGAGLLKSFPMQLSRDGMALRAGLHA